MIRAQLLVRTFRKCAVKLLALSSPHWFVYTPCHTNRDLLWSKIYLLIRLSSTDLHKYILRVILVNGLYWLTASYTEWCGLRKVRTRACNLL